MPDYLLVSFNFQARPPNTDDLAPALSQARDSVRYAPNCWIVWTSDGADAWYSTLRPLLRDDESVFICKLDIRNRAGYLPGLVSDWLDRERVSEYGGGILNKRLPEAGSGIAGAAGEMVPPSTGSD